MNIQKWYKTCPECGEKIFYSTKRAKIGAEKRNTNCHLCAMRSDEVRKNISESNKGQVPWNKGKTNVYSKKALKNMRISALKRIERQKGQVIPNSNPKATQIIRAKAKELGIIDLRDAETPGGEFQVCGYFVDGHSKGKNIVIEYYEKAHKYKKERDEHRKQEIIKELGCKFIEIWE